MKVRSCDSLASGCCRRSGTSKLRPWAPTSLSFLRDESPVSGMGEAAEKALCRGTSDTASACPASPEPSPSCSGRHTRACTPRPRGVPSTVTSRRRTGGELLGRKPSSIIAICRSTTPLCFGEPTRMHSRRMPRRSSSSTNFA